MICIIVNIKVTRLAKSKSLVFFIIRYVVGLGLQNPEQKKKALIGHSVAEILNVKVMEINNFGG